MQAEYDADQSAQNKEQNARYEDENGDFLEVIPRGYATLGRTGPMPRRVLGQARRRQAHDARTGTLPCTFMLRTLLIVLELRNNKSSS